MKIKICGLRERAHAQKAADLGADFLGFVFARSPRQVAPEAARGIISGLPAKVKKVGVFVNEDPAVINDIVRYCGLDLVQLHGDETPADCHKIVCPVIKAWRVKDEQSISGMSEYRDSAEMFLLDTFVSGAMGGTGQTFDWSLARQAAGLGRIMLAGGLTPENVGSAIETADPYGVDVSSGVETAGVKDPVKIAAFIEQVRGRANV